MNYSQNFINDLKEILKKNNLVLSDEQTIEVTTPDKTRIYTIKYEDGHYNISRRLLSYAPIIDTDLVNKLLSLIDIEIIPRYTPIFTYKDNTYFAEREKFDSIEELANKLQEQNIKRVFIYMLLDNHDYHEYQAFMNGNSIIKSEQLKDVLEQGIYIRYATIPYNN